MKFRHKVFVTLSFGLIILGLGELAWAQNGDVCRFYVFFYNDNRYVEGAPCCAECCCLTPHTAPFGNWGVDSNAGSRVNGDQFRGWHLSSSGKKHWNSCGHQFTAPDCEYYNAAGCTEQAGEAGAQWYATLILDEPVNGALGCSSKDGSNLTINDNWMQLWELDAPDGDTDVGLLIFPDLTAGPLSCTHDFCDTADSPWEWATYREGANDLPNAAVQISVEAEFIEGEFVADAREESGFVESLLSRINSWLPHSQIFTAVMQPFVLPLQGNVQLAASTSGPVVDGEVRQGSGALDVLVQDRAGAPVANASVLVAERSGTNLVVRSRRSDKDGTVTFWNLRAGGFEVVAFGAGFGRSRGEVLLSAGDRPSVVLTMDESASVFGSVLTSDREPLEDVTLAVEYPPPAPLQSRGKVVRIRAASWHGGTLKTNQEGRFEIRGIDPYVAFSIVATHPVFGLQRTGTLSLAPGETTTVQIAFDSE